MTTPTIRRLPSWAPMAGLTLGSTVLLKRGQESCLAHELVHVAQQAQDGFLRFAWRYATSAAWRVRYEAPAYAVDVRNRRHTLDSAARALSGPLYWRPCSYDEARVAIQRAMEGA